MVITLGASNGTRGVRRTGIRGLSDRCGRDARGDDARERWETVSVVGDGRVGRGEAERTGVRVSLHGVAAGVGDDTWEGGREARREDRRRATSGRKFKSGIGLGEPKIINTSASHVERWLSSMM